jgi:hypothetical protein
MREGDDFIWINGEKNRQLSVYRPCPCAACSKNCKGVGYLSFSDASGRGFTIWLEDERVFRALKSALGCLRNGRPDTRSSFVVSEKQSAGRVLPPGPRPNRQ